MAKSSNPLPEEYTIEDAFEASVRMSSIETYLKKAIYGREQAVCALLYAVTTGENLMLDGQHGLAKSMLADHFFKCLDPEINTFKKQLSRATDPEELFGAFNLKRYKEDAIYEYNVENFLPTAHFGYLDEVYRGSDKLLPTLMSLLNEREFKNGTEILKCPLITTIGTTNFITETNDLEAFNDRWLFHVKVAPIPENEVFQMLKSVEGNDADIEEVQPFRLRDIRALQFILKNLTFKDNFLTMFAKFLKQFVKVVAPGAYISDRRKLQTLAILRLAYISEVFGDDSIAEEDITFDSEYFDIDATSRHAMASLMTAQYGLMQVGNPEKDSQYESFVRDFVATEKVA